MATLEDFRSWAEGELGIGPELWDGVWLVRIDMPGQTYAIHAQPESPEHESAMVLEAVGDCPRVSGPLSRSTWCRCLAAIVRSEVELAPERITAEIDASWGLGDEEGGLG